jgi:hypothetical protein
MIEFTEARQVSAVLDVLDLLCGSMMSLMWPFQSPS